MTPGAEAADRPHPREPEPPERLEENASSVEVELTREDLTEIGEALAGIQIQGDRDPTDHKRMTGR